MPSLSTLTTKELLIDAKAGDGTAINQLLDRHQESVRRLVQQRLDKKVQRRVGVSDVVQEVLMDANRRLSRYLEEPVMSFHMWLLQIANDRMIDTYRRHRVSAKRSIDREMNINVPRERDNYDTDLLGLLAGPNEAPVEKIIRDERAVQIRKAIALLSELDLEIVTLRHYESLSNQEISRLLNLSEPAASMRYLRAIKRLREIIQDRTNESN